MTSGTINIASLIPHSGSMCLLDTVTQYDEQHIVCCAHSHRHTENPLRHAGQLSICVGIEYAAQAVAVHGGLLAQQRDPQAPPRPGMIAILSAVRWHTDRLDTVADTLDIRADKLADLPQGLQYHFSLSAACSVLLEGDMIIALPAVAAA